VPIRWSELAPAVLPKQTVITVEVSNGEVATTGIASLTHYVEPDAPGHRGDLETPLAQWLGATVQGLPGEPAREANPYDPADQPLWATVELAVLDAIGRETQLPAAAFLGQICRTSIPAYASLPSFALPDAAVDCAVAAVAAGFNAVKFHASGLVEDDRQTIDLARRELGPTIALMWDASCAYELYSAVLIGKALAQADFLWFEAPLVDESTAALRSLARCSSVPLVPDGLVQRPAADWARDVRDGVWGALRLDVTRSAGVSSALRLLRLSEALGLPCEIQSFGFPLGQYANLQLMLTTRACRFFEAPFPASDFEDELATAPPVGDGTVFAPEEPGLGHEVDIDRLAERCRPLATLSL
jgi:L-alanine-DL-glutamate epimerase-like enolase superfamily enzyme